MLPSTHRTLRPRANAIRTDVYFGTDIPSGGTVNAAQWRTFAHTVIAPRLPDGFTVTDGDGEYQMRDGRAIRERSHILTVISLPADRERREHAITAIIDAYKARFRQESVLRLTEATRAQFA